MLFISLLERLFSTFTWFHHKNINFISGHFALKFFLFIYLFFYITSKSFLSFFWRWLSHFPSRFSGWLLILVCPDSSDTVGISTLSPSFSSAPHVTRLGVWKLLLRNSIKSFSDGGKHLIPRCFASHRWRNLFNFAPTSRKLLCYVWLCCPLRAGDAATLKVATWT